MLEDLSQELGLCFLYTGKGYPHNKQWLNVEKGPTYDRTTVISRIKTWIAFSFKAFFKALHLEKTTFLFVTTNPPILPHVVWILHKLRGTPYALLIWDIYPDHIIKAGLIKRRGLLSRIWNKLNKFAMLNASVVITIGDKMADILRLQLGNEFSRCRIEIIHNWADTDFLHPITKAENPFAIAHKQSDKITVLYSGNMGRSHDLGIVLEAARELQTDERISFLLIGQGEGVPDMVSFVQTNALSNVLILPLQPLEVLPYSLSTGDIAVITQVEGTEYLSMPSKTYSLLAAGCAIIACTNEDSDLARLVRNHDVGFVCSQSDVDGFINYIRRLADDHDLLVNLKRNAREAAIQYYSTDVIFNKFRLVLSSAISEKY